MFTTVQISSIVIFIHFRRGRSRRFFVVGAGLSCQRFFPKGCSQLKVCQLSRIECDFSKESNEFLMNYELRHAGILGLIVLHFYSIFFIKRFT